MKERLISDESDLEHKNVAFSTVTVTVFCKFEQNTKGTLSGPQSVNKSLGTKENPLY